MKNKRQIADESTNWAADEWHRWLSERLERRLATFRNEPEEMIGAFDRERLNIDDYRGREILELLQNADDAGVGYGDNAAMIRWWKEGVCVANSGVPFSEKGLDSLIVGNLSPKKLDRTRYIGNRGLGFRSVLAWTDCPFILSGSLRLGFSPSLARASLKKLSEESERVRHKVSEWTISEHQRPIPIFSCPTIIGNEQAERLAKDVGWQQMWKRAIELRSHYDTVVVLPFTEVDAAKQALEQIGGLKVELVLFLQHLKEIVIEIPNQKIVWHAKRKRNSVSVTVEPDEPRSKRWKIFPKTGLIPEDLLTPGLRGTPAFEIRIAVPNAQTESGFLYSYFPTNVSFPYPVVAHATMELTSNRQNLINSPPNRFLATKLAETIAGVAEKCVDPAQPWQALKLIADRGKNVDPVLEKLGFGDALLKAARKKKIVPRRDGVFVTPGRVKQVPVETDGWLPLRRLRDIVLWTDDGTLNQCLEWLQIEDLSEADFIARIDRLSANLAIKERAVLLLGLIKNRDKRFVPTNPPANLLIDESGNKINASTPAYFPPTSEVSFDKPRWMSVSFVSRELVQKMLEICDYSRDRLVEELRKTGFKNLHEYDFRGVARAIVTQTSARCREDPEQSNEIRLEGIGALRNLWLTAKGQEAPTREDTLKVDLPTRHNEWKKADDLYLGTPYQKGVLMEVLLGQLHPELFVASPDAFALENNAESWQDFLLWLGVVDLPREELITCRSWSDRDYLKYVQKMAKYPIRFIEFTVHSPEELNLDSIQVTSIEHIVEIIDNTDAHAVLSWIAVDNRIGKLCRQGDANAILTASFRSSTVRKSSHPVPSFIQWLLYESEWMPTTTGEKRSPNECVLTRTVGDEIQRVFPRPAVNQKAEIFKQLQIHTESINQALMTTGVRLSLEDITWAQWYDLMFRLPNIDPEGNIATRIYRIVTEKREDDESSFAVEAQRQEFQEKGKLWSCVNDKCLYVPIADGVYYADDATIPKAILHYFPVIDLPRRRGLEKTARIFGVKILRNRDIEITMNQFDEVPQSDVLNDELQRLKPYVLSVRLDATPDVLGLPRFKALKIIPCSSVNGRARVNGRDLEISLVEPGGSVIVENEAYLIVPHTVSEPFFQDAMVARHVASILSEVLDVERASDFTQIVLAKDHETRKEVLSDILGHDAEKILARASESLRIEVEEDLQPGRVWESLTEKLPDPKPTPTDQESASKDGEMPTTGGGEVDSVPAHVKAEAEEREPAEPRRTIEKRKVSTEKSTRERVRRAHRVTDGDRCEELVERFEESRGEFPLRVSGLQGAEGYGCDILSFSTKEDREEFRQSKGKRIPLVQRFIEVKGRSTQQGTIPLEGNQLRAARHYQEKYYMYRVYEAVSGQEWEVVELANPVDYPWEISYVVDPFRCHATKYWTVTTAK